MKQAVTAIFKVLGSFEVELNMSEMSGLFSPWSMHQGGSAAPPGDLKTNAASPPKLASSKGLLDPPTSLC
jgi:hypothetical protein